jgi:uncharacterized protein YhaN
VRSGLNLLFLADDLFVNFDDQRAEAGFKVLAEVARSTQVLFLLTIRTSSLSPVRWWERTPTPSVP